MFPGRPEHLKTFDYLGLHRYFLTFCTLERRRVFVTPEAVDAVRTQVLRAAVDERCAFLAYCFMPDHLHLLLEAQSDDSDCRRFIARGKQVSGFHYKKQCGQPLWQRYGFERTLLAAAAAEYERKERSRRAEPAPGRTPGARRSPVRLKPDATRPV